MINKSKLEIERKYVLKNLPVELVIGTNCKVFFMKQFYFGVDGVWQRFRISEYRGFGRKPIFTYTHTIKKKLEPGVYEETEKKITQKQYEQAFITYSSCDKKFISKTRYVIKHKNLKFEIDVYDNIKLIILEVELPSIEYKFKFPAGLEKYIIADVTTVSGFGNSRMAEKF